MEARDWEGVGVVRHLLVVFLGPAGRIGEADLSEYEARCLGADITWVPWGRAPAEAVRDKLRVLGYAPAAVTCVGLTPAASAAALAGGLAAGVAAVVGLGLTVAAQESLAASEPAPTTRVMILAAANDPDPEANVASLRGELARLPHVAVVEWLAPRDRDFAAMARSARPYWLSLLTVLCHGTDLPLAGHLPIGDVPDGDARAALAQWERDEGVFELHRAALAGGSLSVEGVAFLRGRPLPDYGIASRWLVLESADTRRVVPLGGVKDDQLTDRYAKQVRLDYGAGGFADPRHAGLPVADLPRGRYQVSLRITEYGRTRERPLDFRPAGRVADGVGSKVLTLAADSFGHAIVDVAAFAAADPAGQVDVRIDQADVAGTVLSLRGRLAVEGLPVRTHGEGTFWLWLRDRPGGTSRLFRLGTVVNAQPVPFGRSEEYAAANFADIHQRGIDLASLAPGRYAARIGLATGAKAVSVGVGWVVVGDDAIHLEVQR
ncbi:MAG: hypothetical protein LBI33_00180 [Propionibacteriaceae bacterium]|jgi:hypothetical protein|nr:hypothetical protein [Propionibacteriaceae bacterium]